MSNYAVQAENFLDIAHIALGAVADKYLVGFNIDASGLIVVFDNGVQQEVVALLRAVAAEAGGFCHFVNSGVEPGNDGFRQRTGHVADP